MSAAKPEIDPCLSTAPKGIRIAGKFLTPEEWDAKMAVSTAMIKVREECLQTAPELRRAFLFRGRHRVGGGLIFKPLCLGIIWLFEELRHPFNEGKKTGKGPSLADTARAVYVFVAPEEAAQALEEGIANFDANAAEIVSGLHPRRIREISEIIRKIYQQGMETSPGGGLSENSEPNGAAKGNQTVPPREVKLPPKTNGMGWTFTLLEQLLAEYSWPSYIFQGELRGPEDWIAWHVPLQRAFALHAGIGPRNGVEPEGLSFQARAMIRAKREAEAAGLKNEVVFADPTARAF